MLYVDLAFRLNGTTVLLGGRDKQDTVNLVTSDVTPLC